MSRPGTQVEVVDRIPPRSAPTRTDTAFVVGETTKGPVGEAIEVTSMDRLEQITGARAAFGFVFDAVDTIFREGGSKVYVSRVVGPAPINALAKIFDQAGSTDPADVALVATAVNPGSWANSLNVEITVDTTNFVVIVSDDVAGELERSPLLVDRAAAVAWAAGSDYIRLTLGASNEDPRAQGPTSLATGTDDRASITDSQWDTALAAFDADLGPGQVLAPGRTSDVAHGQVIEHAAATNRVALLDAVDTASASTVRSAGQAMQTLDGGRFGQLLAPWANIPGLVAGTTRQVPYSAVQAGIDARNDQLGISPNVAAAGKNGLARYARDATQEYSEQDRDSLNTAGVTVARVKNGQLQTYGLRSCADPDSDALWLQFAGARFLMGIRAKAGVIADSYLFEQIDGRGHVFRKFQADLEGMLLPYYDAGSLFGASPAEAFIVDVGAQVNTPESIADGQINASIGARISPGAEFVFIQIARTAVDQPL